MEGYKKRKTVTPEKPSRDESISKMTLNSFYVGYVLLGMWPGLKSGLYASGNTI